MKKVGKRLLAAVMALAMTMGFTLVSAGAKPKTFQTYTVIGDSIAAGYALSGDDFASQLLNVPAGEVVQGSYADLVGRALGVQKTYNTSRVVYTTENYLRYLDPDYEHEINHPSNYYERFVTDCDLFQTEIFHPGDYARQKAAVREQVQQANLITVNLGSNDVMTNAIFAAAYKMLYYSFGIAGQAALSVLERDFQTASSAEDLFRMLSCGNEDLFFKTMLQEADLNMKKFQRNYPRLIRDIHTLNPDARILALGMYSMFRLAEPEGQLKDYLYGVTGQYARNFNLYLQQECPARSLYMYVDVYNTETHPAASLTTPSYWACLVVNCHPDRNGHKYIASQILNALK